MSNYTPEEVDMLIDMLKVKAPHRVPEIVNGKPLLNKTERTIKFLDSRHKFFNPTREMLTYIIDMAKSSKLDPVLVKKMKEDLLTKR